MVSKIWAALRPVTVGVVGAICLATPGWAEAPAATPGAGGAQAAAPVRTSVKVREGTEVRIAIDDPLSSKTASAGDNFTFHTTETIRLADGTIIPEGYHGRGEVTDVEKKGMLGKAGRLNIRLNYITVGDVRLHLRMSTAAEGKSGVATTVALTLIITPLFLMHHSADAKIVKGQAMTAFVDTDTDLPFPLPAISN